MEFLIVLLVLALAAVIIAFTVRVKVLKRSFREIAFGMEEKMREDSNTPLRAPSADKEVVKLVSYLNAQVDGAIAAKRQYEDADSEHHHGERDDQPEQYAAEPVFRVRSPYIVIDVLRLRSALAVGHFLRSDVRGEQIEKHKKPPVIFRRRRSKK